LLQYPDVLILVGIEREEEMDQLMAVYGGSHALTEKDKQDMERLREDLGTRFCRRCDYCQPCPEGLPISMVMHARSNMKRMPGDRLVKGWFAEGMEKAENCTKCGECISKCPYGLPIPDMIDENLALFKGERERYLKDNASTG
jgi:predicted aldo/keto reductase-like oxidoreductase